MHVLASADDSIDWAGGNAFGTADTIILTDDGAHLSRPCRYGVYRPLRWSGCKSYFIVNVLDNFCNSVGHWLTTRHALIVRLVIHYNSYSIRQAAIWMFTQTALCLRQTGINTCNFFLHISRQCLDIQGIE